MEMKYELIEDKKTKIIERLSSDYAQNNISLEEYERLIEYCHKIETDKELTILENILEKTIEENNPIPKSSEQIKSYNNSASSYSTILSTRKITGLAANVKMVNILGETKIYINEEDLIKNETALNVLVVLGEIKIYVPEDVDVICNAIPILGEITIKENPKNTGRNKKLIITGNVILGEIKVKTKQ